jgi:hypothetical protein
MLIIRRTHLFLILLLILCFIFYIGIRGYIVLKECAGYDAGERKYQAELFLYTCIIAAITCLFCFLFIMARSRNIVKNLDKLIEMSQTGGFSSTQGLEKLGGIGMRIKKLYFNLDNLNEKQSLKISTQSSVIQLLLTLLPFPLIMTDIDGKITGISRVYEEGHHLKKDSIKNHFIGDVIPAIGFNTIIKELKDKPGQNSFRINDNITVSVIKNKEGQPSQLLIFLEKRETIAPVMPVKKPYRTLTGFFKKVFRKK